MPLTCLLLNVLNCFPCFGSNRSCFLLDAPIHPIAGLATVCYYIGGVQWNLSIKDTLNIGSTLRPLLNKEHLSNEDTVCNPNHPDLCACLPLNLEHLSIQDRQLGPSGVLYRNPPLYLKIQCTQTPLEHMHALCICTCRM